MAGLVPADTLKDYIGKDMGASDWLKVYQNRINQLEQSKEPILEFDRLISTKFSEKLFSLNVGDLDVVPNDDKVYIVKVDTITPATLTSEEGLLLRDQIRSQLSKSLEQDIFSALIKELEKTNKIFINQLK